MCAGLLAASAAGCTLINAYEDPALVGEWKSDPIPGTTNRANKLEAEVDGEGTATIWYVDTVALEQRDKFKIEWEQDDNREFEIELKCTSSTLLADDCRPHNFNMVCEVDKKGDDLDCNANPVHPFSDPRLRWSRD